MRTFLLLLLAPLVAVMSLEESKTLGGYRPVKFNDKRANDAARFAVDFLLENKPKEAGKYSFHDALLGGEELSPFEFKVKIVQAKQQVV
mmetsp:Transcript_27443/g.42197  ORF Transcript_27443/g.42197 Transcript_27443/m.42197 type:complete len:89 (-) Transcript_27443:325-591(-)